MIIETILEHVARALNKDPILVKEINLYEEGQVKAVWTIDLIG